MSVSGISRDEAADRGAVTPGPALSPPANRPLAYDSGLFRDVRDALALATSFAFTALSAIDEDKLPPASEDGLQLRRS
jgi:hypothetical protein